jgi:hypothetical protein
MSISGLSTQLSDDHQPLRPFQKAKIGGQTNNASQVLEALRKLIPAKIDQDSMQEPRMRNAL